MSETPLGSSYVTMDKIGGGAMGAVFEGRDHKGGRYAVKVLRSELAEDPAIVQRFVQERSSLTSIDHLNVVRMHDLVVEGSTLAIVMDRVSGGDLRGALDSFPTLPPAEVARLGAGIAAGLAAVHKAGLVHRDIKPENVLLDTTSSPATPKVTDFGIARIADASATTRSSMMVGTPNYMAPEISEGATPTPAVDVYALGILLYEMASGVTPFEGGSYLAVIRRHSEQLPGRPDGIPDDLWSAIEDMLAKDPTERPSAQQLVPYLVSLSTSLRGAPAAAKLDVPPATRASQTETLARPAGTVAAPAAAVAPTGGGATAEPGKKRRVLLPALLALAFVAALGLGAAWYLGMRETDDVVAADDNPTGSEEAEAPTDIEGSEPTDEGDIRGQSQSDADGGGG